ncbi:MAG: BtpA/SgcQ family protein [Oscillospiraceae bacterium]|nr:BtpA/SgcQ family protein [Oscillospiraceae bacterium]
MWIKELFDGRKPVIGMVHLDALPGTAMYDSGEGLEGIIRKARLDYDSLTEGGIDGVIFCNENDKPYCKKAGAETVASMTGVISAVTLGRETVPFGVDIQWDVPAALAVAMATGAAFVRGIACGTFCGDLGIFCPDTEGIMKYRKAMGAEQIRILTNLMPEFSCTMDTRPITLVAQTVPKSTLVDGICVSGVMAGKAAPYDQLTEIKETVGDFPVIANTGVNFDTVGRILKIADACVVATCLKVDGKSFERIDRARVQKLMEIRNAAL